MKKIAIFLLLAILISNNLYSNGLRILREKIFTDSIINFVMDYKIVKNKRAPNNNIYLAGGGGKIDSSGVSFVIIDTLLNIIDIKIQKYYNQFVKTYIYSNENFLEFYTSLVGSKVPLYFFDWQFQVERYDWDFNQLYFNCDSTNNTDRYNVDRMSYKVRKKGGGYLATNVNTRNFKVDSAHKIYVIRYDTLGHFIDETIIDSLYYNSKRYHNDYTLDLNDYGEVFILYQKFGDSVGSNYKWMLKKYDTNFRMVKHFYLTEAGKFTTSFTLGESKIFQFELPDLGPNFFKIVLLKEQNQQEVIKEKVIQLPPEIKFCALQSLISTSDGGYLIGGFNIVEKEDEDLVKRNWWSQWLLKLNSDLEIEQEYRWNPQNNKTHKVFDINYVTDLYELENGKFLLIGKRDDKFWAGIADGILSNTLNVKHNDFVDTFLEIQPNPTYDLATIKCSSIENGIIKIFNSFGQEIFDLSSLNWTQNSNFKELSVNIKNLPSGEYFVIAVVNDRKYLTSFVVLH